MIADEKTERHLSPFSWKQLRDLWHDRIPGQLVIQLTNHCNGRCPQCGMRATEPFRRSRLSVDQVKRIVDAAVARGIDVISFTGGEPLLFMDDLTTLIQYASDAGVKYIRTGTNGFLFTGPWDSRFASRVARIADKLAAVPLRNLWFSIDSTDAGVHEEMRGLPGVIEGIRKALPLFHERGIYPTANLGINRNMGGRCPEDLSIPSSPTQVCSREDFYHHFRRAFTRFYEFVIELGFTLVNSCYPMSMDKTAEGANLGPVYAAESSDRVVRFSSEEKAVLFQALLDAIPQFRSRIRIFSPRCALHTLIAEKEGRPHISYPCRGGTEFFFIDAATGDTYPCGYRGKENLGKLWQLSGRPHGATGPCTSCDWECFRDPSILLGPVLMAATHPLRLARSFSRDRTFFDLWKEDASYYLACDFFDGRKPPDFSKLEQFASPRVPELPLVDHRERPKAPQPLRQACCPP
jgi:MoaA/NifB/PqqE/SkfB family radical SAM enzyme